MSTVPSSSKTKELQLFSCENIRVIAQNANLSQRQALSVSSGLRFFAKNRKLIEPGLKTSFAVANKECSDLFTIEKIDDVTGVFCTDLHELLTRAAHKRGHGDLDGAKAHIGLDTGSGFLKCCVSLLYPEDLVQQHEVKGRQKYDSVGLKANFKNSGVKRLLLAGIAPVSKESYPIVQEFLRSVRALNLPTVESIFLGDLKILNVCCGLQSHSARHPCVFCTWQRQSPPGGNNPLRTFEGIRENRQKWLERTSGDRTRLSDFFNCEFEPMDNFPASGVVMEHIPIPELHCLLGVTNKLYSECEKELPAIEQWSKQLHLVRERYFSKTFEGNECKALLDNVHVLEDICRQQNANSKVWCIVKAFTSFGKVVNSCFGQELKPSFREDLKKFTNDYVAIGSATITPKVHIVMDHVGDFCASHGCGLGQFSEQASEGVHREFRKYWERHLVKDPSASRFGQNLHQSVLEYTATHLG